MTTRNVMIDLETMGVGPRAAVVAIGAVKFDLATEPGEFVDTYEATISLSSCLANGLEVDGRTIEWWLRQSDAARSCLTFEGTLHGVLNDFSDWYGPESVPTWGNGASFDCVVLGSAYRAIGCNPPWNFRDEMCFRTMRRMFPGVPRVEPKTAHRALSDAEAQTEHLQRIFRAMTGSTCEKTSLAGS